MKSVFITGAASGIGLATARHFAAKGCFVGLYDINQQGLDSAMASGDFPAASSGICDVNSRDSISAALADFASHTNGQCHILVNNAGVLSNGPFIDIAPEAHDLMIDINIRGLTHVAQLGFPLLKATPGASLVNLCSSSSIHGVPELAVYSSTKFYVNGLTQALHLEWEQHDIRVTCVKPHIVNTPMAAELQEDPDSADTVNLSPEEIAQAIDTAASGTRVSYIIGKQAKSWALLTKFLPESMQLGLVRRLMSQLE